MQRISRKLKILAIAMVMQIVPVYAQTELNQAKIATSTNQNDIAIKNDDATLQENKAVFLERSSETVTGNSSSQAVVFSASNVGQKIHIAYRLNDKEFLFIFDAISVDQKQLNSLQLIPGSSGQDKKTAEDDADLSVLYSELKTVMNPSEPLESGLLASLDLLINLVPKNTFFDVMDLQTAPKSGVSQPKSYTTICKQRGKARTANFDDLFGSDYSSERMVGNPRSGCLGRCGTGCTQPLQDRKRQYTSACFDHDLCTVKFGDNPLGDCTDEFADAADGYLNAPNCSYWVIGQWKSQYQLLCKGITHTTMVTYYSNHRFKNSAGISGDWQLQANKVVRTYDNGAKFIGSIDDTNEKTTGTMVSANGVKGCFTDSYLTTFTR